MTRYPRPTFRASLLILLINLGAWGQRYTITTLAAGRPPADGIAAVNAYLGPVTAVTSDGQNVYVSTASSCVFRISAAGVITRIAGNWRAGFKGDGGPAVNSQLSSPNGMAVDSAGNVYIADRGNNVIRKIDTAGIISTVAGVAPTSANPLVDAGAGYNGDNIPATTANLWFPSAVAVDAAGNLYIAESGDSRVRKVSTDGIIRTIAGTGFAGYNGDGADATILRLRSPQGIAVDGSGNVYIADTFNNLIRKLSPNGTLTTIAGSANACGCNLATDLSSPRGVAVDAAGNLFIADYGWGVVRKVLTNRTMTIVAGTGNGGFSGETGVATKVDLYSAASVALDSAGNLYIADYYNGRVRQVTPGGTLKTYAGNDAAGDGGPASQAQLLSPSGVALDGAGNLFFADQYTNRVRRIDTNGVISLIAGSGLPGFGGDGGAATAANLNSPTSVAADKAGNVYVADPGNHRVRVVRADRTIGTAAGNGKAGFSGDGQAAFTAQLNTPQGVAIAANGDLLIADTYNNRIRRVTASGSISTIAGTAANAPNDPNHLAVNTGLMFPERIATDPNGGYYFSQIGLYGVYRVTAAGVISAMATGGNAPGINGAPPVSVPYASHAPALDAAGNLYLLDDEANAVFVMTPDGAIAKVAGNGSLGYSPDGTPALNAELGSPQDLTVDSAGNIYLADTANAAIRILKPLAPAITASSVTNAASNKNGPIVPGEIVVIYGSNLGPDTLAQPVVTSAGFPTAVGGIRVLFNGVPAPIVYTSASAVSCIVPYDVTGGTASVVVQFGHLSSAPVNVSVSPASPALFIVGSVGAGAAAALNQDGVTYNSPNAPAPAGSVIVLYATGEGQTSPAGVNGKLTTAPLPKPILPVSVTIGGKNADVLYAGGAPGLVAGLLQVNAVIPPDIPAGTATVTIQVGTATSQAGVTIAVGGK